MWSYSQLCCCSCGCFSLLCLRDQFGEEFIALGTEVGLKAIEKERIRLHCAEHYYRNNAEVKDTTANIVRTLLCLIKLYDRHLQMKLVTVLQTCYSGSLFFCLCAGLVFTESIYVVC